MNYDELRFPGWGGIALLAISACGETSNNPKSSASDGSSGSTDTGTAVTSGTGGTAAATTVSAVTTNGTTNGTTTNGSTTTGGTGPVVNCFTFEEVRDAEEGLPSADGGAGGEGGVASVWQCPEYFPHPLGPPCGGIRLPEVEPDQDTCCYSAQICN